MRLARLVSVLALIAASAPCAFARRVEDPPPLLEALVRGERMPASVPDAGGKSHVLDDADRAMLLELVRAHVANDPAPFRKALDRGAPWLVRATLESLVYARVGFRREDEALVTSFLPDLVRLAADADLRRPALDALGALATRAHDEETRSKARDAFLSALIEWGEPEALWVLGLLLRPRKADIPGDLPLYSEEEFPMSPAQKDGIRRLLLKHMERPALPAWRVAAAVSSPEVVEAARARGDEWLPVLAAAGHPDVPKLVLAVLSRPRARSWDRAVDAALVAAAIRPDAAYLPALETFRPGEAYGPMWAIAAIDSPAARPLLERWARTIGSGLNCGSWIALERWLAMDRSGALAWLRQSAREGTPESRALALQILAESGEPDLFPAIQALLDPKSWGYSDAYSVLVRLVRRPEETAARDFARSLAGGTDFRAIELLEALHQTDPEALESVMLARLGTLPSSPDWRHVHVMRVLGGAGGTRSLQALAAWTTWREPADPDCFDFHLVARSAIGQIERRLGL